MLSLTLSSDQAICIGNDILIVFESVCESRQRVKIKTFAPKEVSIKRLEIYENRDRVEKDLKEYFTKIRRRRTGRITKKPYRYNRSESNKARIHFKKRRHLNIGVDN
ncbi:carbon storage regulator [Zooshikella ganghwensis]|uniref:Carbon storage regulator n=1 Tax=Zooshikella ganghwensis TaxID=202772 RepID=A0A4P9VQR5_9GAMM|nr:carbon storage regulator [Zooshikella ganghwensis]RDH45376.1 carbon storage regulator [Zooshikella ganghwensis]